MIRLRRALTCGLLLAASACRAGRQDAPQPRRVAVEVRFVEATAGKDGPRFSVETVKLTGPEGAWAAASRGNDRLVRSRVRVVAGEPERAMAVAEPVFEGLRVEVRPEILPDGKTINLQVKAVHQRIARVDSGEERVDLEAGEGTTVTRKVTVERPVLDSCQTDGPVRLADDEDKVVAGTWSASLDGEKDPAGTSLRLFIFSARIAGD